MAPIKVTHIVPGLGIGGAELMLVRLLKGMDPIRFESRIISLTECGVLGNRLAAMGFEVQALGMGSFPSPLRLARLAEHLHRSEPDIVQTWLYAADLVGGLATRAVGQRNVVWNLRQSAPQRHQAPLRHLWTARTCAVLSSYLPRVILSCSEDARRSHEALGYKAEIVVVPNGFETELLAPDPSARASVRAELSIGGTTELVGTVARFDPVKGHRDLLEAVRDVGRLRPAVHLLLCGEGIVSTNQKLVERIDHYGLTERTHLLGPRDDVPRLLAALDVFVSSSHSEGFPNVVGEAMASSVPCVVTDVGDSASVVGDTGLTVAPRAPHELATAIDSVLSLDPEARAAMGSAARQRVEQHYSMSTVVDRYGRLYEDLVRSGDEHQPPCRT